MWIVPGFAEFVRFISPKGNEVDVIARQIANAHMSFNIINTLIWLPLIPVMVKIVNFIVRGTDKQNEIRTEPLYLDSRVLNQPVAAMHLATQEVKALFENVQILLQDVKKSFISGDTEVLKKADESATWLERVNHEIVQYMSALFAGGGLTEEMTTEAAALMYVVNDVDKIRDRCADISKITRDKIFDEYEFSDMAMEELDRCFDFVIGMMQKAKAIAETNDKDLAVELLDAKDKLRKMERKFNKNHVKRMKKNDCKPELTGAFSGVLMNLDRIGTSCTNIAEEILDED